MSRLEGSTGTPNDYRDEPRPGEPPRDSAPLRGPSRGLGEHHHGRPGGPGGPGGRGRQRRRGGRGRRGEVRIAVLTLLHDRPMHGYQIMQTISERTDGRWSPSPGAVYPTLAALEDEGLVTITAEGGRKLVTLTNAGRTLVSEHATDWADPFPSASGVNLRVLVDQVADATRHVGRAGTDDQRERAAELLTRLRRELYLLLAEEPEADASDEAG